jgi:multiple sugar transport system substrate-binding protein
MQNTWVGRQPARALLVLWLVAGVAAVAALGATARTTSASTVDLKFQVWSYSIPTIQSNIKRFQTLYPGVKVNLSDTSWFDYHDVMATKFTGGGAPDIAYSSDHWLREWVAANWIAPLDKYFPQFTKYKKEWAPYAREGMTLDGHLYGLPYYADLIDFIYNADQVKQAGFNGAPKTWDDVKKISLALKQKNIVRYPLNIPLKKDDPWLIEIFYSMVYGNGGHMFDKKDNPVFNKRGSAAEKMLQWLQDARTKWKILDPAGPESAEPDVVKTMGGGHSTFTVLAKYNLAELNLGQHKEAGHFKLALMPGATHSTVGFVRFYAMTANAAKRGSDVTESVGKFLQYFGGKTGGKYAVEKRWALEKGLGFANLPLYNDPQIKKAINKWGSVPLEQSQAKLAHVKEGLTPFWGVWDISAREQLDKAILGQESPRQALKNMADRWNQLKKQYKR